MTSRVPLAICIAALLLSVSVLRDFYRVETAYLYDTQTDRIWEISMAASPRTFDAWKDFIPLVAVWHSDPIDVRLMGKISTLVRQRRTPLNVDATMSDLSHLGDEPVMGLNYGVAHESGDRTKTRLPPAFEKLAPYCDGDMPDVFLVHAVVSTFDRGKPVTVEVISDAVLIRRTAVREIAVLDLEGYGPDVPVDEDR